MRGTGALDKDLEGFGDTGSRDILALNDGLVGLDSAHYVIRLDGKYLLKGVCCAVCLERPNLHLAETLAAELSFTAQRLLSDEGVRAGRTGVDLIVNKVMELKIIHDADGYGVIKLPAGSAVGKDGLAVHAELRHLGGVEFNALLLGLLLSLFHSAAVCLRKCLGDILLMGAVEYGGHYLVAERSCGKAEVNLENLTDIHSAGNAEGIKNYIKRCAVGQEGHILLRKDP